jgi:hypothetical protein
MSDEMDKEPPIVRRVKIAQAEGAPRPPEYERRRPPQRPPSFDARPYLVGGLVSAAVLTLLVIVWLLASPNNPFSSQPVSPPVPALNNNNGANNNGINPFDVPTEVEPVGTGIPAAIPSTGPVQISPVPTEQAPAGGITNYKVPLSVIRNS